MVGVVADHVDAVAFLPRGARPSKKLVGAHDFITPSLPTPAIARPTVWEASQQSVEEVLAYEARARRRLASVDGREAELLRLSAAVESAAACSPPAARLTSKWL